MNATQVKAPTRPVPVLRPAASSPAARAPVAPSYLRSARLLAGPLADVLYFQSRDHLIHVFFASGRNHTIRQKISLLEDTLSADFFRIHKSFIVRLDGVERLIVRRGGKYRVELSDGTLLPVSRRIYPTLRGMLAGRG